MGRSPGDRAALGKRGLVPAVYSFRWSPRAAPRMRGSPYNRHPLGTLLVLWLASLVLVLLALFVLDAIAYA